eukprot:scaffold257570_cov32-Prasinocladus_malaysianus.AAC.1
MPWWPYVATALQSSNTHSGLKMRSFAHVALPHRRISHIFHVCDIDGQQRKALALLTGSDYTLHTAEHIARQECKSAGYCSRLQTCAARAQTPASGRSLNGAVGPFRRHRQFRPAG